MPPIILNNSKLTYDTPKDAIVNVETFHYVEYFNKIVNKKENKIVLDDKKKVVPNQPLPRTLEDEFNI